MNMDNSTEKLPELMRSAQPRSVDGLTVACIAIVAYLLASVLHEGVSHGLTAAVFGARGLGVSAAMLRLDPQSVTREQSRIICIAGPVGSLAFGLLLAVWHAYSRSGNAEFRYCLWLTAYVCLFQGAGYMMALSFVRFGDIHGFVSGCDAEFAWRLGFTLTGLVLSVVALYSAGHTLDEFLGRVSRRARAAKLLLISYFAGSVPLILSTLLGKDASFVVLFSAIPATLGGTICVPYTAFLVGEARQSTNPVALTPGRSYFWYAAGVIALLVYGLVLGPGVPR
jgi:hypothetical protein